MMGKIDFGIIDGMDFDEDEGENDEDNDDEFKQYANKRDINWEPISSIILQKRK